MTTQSSDTETVVRRHLQVFLEQRGVAAITSDYDDDALLVSERRAYRGRREIAEFFEEFLASLPPHAIDRFELRSLHLDGDLAYISWHAGRELPFGSDTFVVRNGRISVQTVAIHAQPGS